MDGSSTARETPCAAEGLLFSWNPDHHNKTPGSRIDAIEARDSWRYWPPAGLDQLLQLILAGHGWCGAVLAPGPNGLTHRDQQSVAALNLIVLDIDGDWTLEAFWASPFAQRHCLATATTCSHTPEVHRFRAIFQLDREIIGDDIQLLRYLHAEVIDRLDLGPLKDTSGSTPQSLWFGNTAAVIQRNPSPQLLPWELIDDARTEQLAEAQGQAEARARRDADRRREGPEGYEALLQRVIYALDNILPVTADGEYNELLVKVYMAAASSGDERVWDAFARWHSRGHHARSKRNNLRRLERGRHRAGKASDPAVILKLTAQRVPHWRSLLPQHLQSSPPSFSSSLPNLSPIACAQPPTGGLVAALRAEREAISSAPINPGFAAPSQSGPTPLLPGPGQGQLVQPVAGPSPTLSPARSAAENPPVGGAAAIPPVGCSPSEPGSVQQLQPAGSPSPDPTPAQSAATNPPMAGWVAGGVGLREEREIGTGGGGKGIGGGGGGGGGNGGGDGEGGNGGNEWEGYLNGMMEIIEAMHDIETKGMGVYRGQVLTGETAYQRMCLTRFLRDQLLASKDLNRSPETIETLKLMHFRRVNNLPLPTLECKVTQLTGRGDSFQWLIPNILPRGHEMLIHAKQGAGKTTLAMQLCRAMTGDPAISEFLDSGMFNLAGHWRRGRVMMISSDMGKDSVSTLEQYAEKLGWRGEPFLQQLDVLAGERGSNDDPGSGAWLANNGGFQQMLNMMEEAKRNGTPYVAVVIDSMKSVCPPGVLVGSQEFRHTIDLASDICAKYGAALVWVHHSANDGSSQGIKRIGEQVSTELQMSVDPGDSKVKLTFSKVRGAPSRVIYAELRNQPMGMPRLVAGPAADETPQTTASQQREEVVLEILGSDLQEYCNTHPGMTGAELQRSYKGLSTPMILESPAWRDNGLPVPHSRALRRTLGDLAANLEIECLGNDRNTTWRIKFFGGEKEDGGTQGVANF